MPLSILPPWWGAAAARLLDQQFSSFDPVSGGELQPRRSHLTVNLDLGQHQLAITLESGLFLGEPRLALADLSLFA